MFTLKLLFFLGKEWSPEATDLIYELTEGKVVYAQVAGYTCDNIPEIYLYTTLGPNVSIQI